MSIGKWSRGCEYLEGVNTSEIGKMRGAESEEGYVSKEACRLKKISLRGERGREGEARGPQNEDDDDDLSLHCIETRKRETSGGKKQQRVMKQNQNPVSFSLRAVGRGL